MRNITRVGIGLFIAWSQFAYGAEPALPKIFLNTAMPTLSGATITVPDGDFQAALNSAQPGDTIVLTAGSTYTGNFVVPVKSNPSSKWILIRSSKLSSLTDGKRADSSQASLMAKIAAPNSAPAISFAPGAGFYRFAGLEVTVSPTVDLNYQIFEIGTGAETATSQFPHDIVVDRSYVHGVPMGDIKRGIQIDGIRLAVINSYISEIHVIGQDTQAIGGVNAPGPFKIVNNHLEAATENFLMGGDKTHILGLVPSDIEFRQNYLTKNLAWQTSMIQKPTGLSLSATTGGSLKAGTTYYYTVVGQGIAGYKVMANSNSAAEAKITLASGSTAVKVAWTAGQHSTQYVVYRTTDAPTVTGRKWFPYAVATGTGFTDKGATATAGSIANPTVWAVKNIFELKNAQRVLIDGNIMENSWIQGQSGFAVLVTPRTSGGTDEAVVVQDITFSNNVIRHSFSGIQILGQDYLDPNVPSQVSKRIKFKNNLLYDIGDQSMGPGSGRMIVFTSGTKTPGPIDVTFDHNTMGFTNGNSLLAAGTATETYPGLIFTNNIADCGTYGVKGGSMGDAALTANFPSAVFTSNALIGCASNLYAGHPGNFFPATVADVGFVKFTTDVATTNDFDLGSSSVYNSKGSDGTDLGINMAAINAAIGGTAPAPTPTPTPTAGDIVVYALRADAIAGSWKKTADSTAAGGFGMLNPDAGDAKIATPLASPTDYFEVPVIADGGVPYHLWVRMKASANSVANDSIYMQFSGTVTSTGTPIDRHDTTSAETFVLEACDGAVDHGWGWTDNGWCGTGAPIQFSSSGLHTIRIQQREDGPEIDQIVLSPSKYATTAPGAGADDATILSETH